MWCKQGAPRSPAPAVPGKTGRRGWLYDVRDIGAWLVDRGKATQADVDDAIARAGSSPAPTPAKPAPRKKSNGTSPQSGDDLATAKLKAQIAKLEADCKRLELTNKQKEGSHVVVSEIHGVLAELAHELRRVGEILARDFGPGALALVESAIAKVEERCRLAGQGGDR